MKGINSRKIVLALSVAVSAAVIIWYARASPLAVKTRRLSSSLEKQRIEIAFLNDQEMPRLHNELMRLSTVRKTYRLLDRKRRVVSKLIPDSLAVAELLEEIDRVAGRSGVDLVKMGSGGVKEKNGYSVLSVEISVGGGFGELEHFITGLESMGRLVKIEYLEIEGKKGKSEWISADFLVKACAAGRRTDRGG